MTGVGKQPTGIVEGQQYTGSDWRNYAECLDVPVEHELGHELFYPIGKDEANALQIEEAKEYCRSCPVREACLKFAIENDDRFGIFGGTTADERQAEKRRNARARLIAAQPVARTIAGITEPAEAAS